MPVSVNYDIHGTITGVVVSPVGSAVGYLQAMPGERTVMIEESDFQLDARKPPTLVDFETLTKKFCIDTTSPNGKLMKKEKRKFKRS